ncbi:hypothetical protein F441_14728 [Phytophthora nicotianae CJ01A1]|uniref:Uncharacterized protein n=4 Tax=Phytophthora nicotianae TaxID=4792 RepID=W2YU40_PHYNI|nr:hypothetical protein L916_14383 [Phytophthora nicotianae]ETP09408.1 hypothetical protein F441_14728 [Phytophthora nicotianae CJ01A1]ETP37454.1 hypothetical protein F442_14742 [Phytophthora nicotianae P10297]
MRSSSLNSLVLEAGIQGNMAGVGEILNAHFSHTQIFLLTGTILTGSGPILEAMTSCAHQ